MDVIQAVGFCAWWLVVIPASVGFFLWVLEGGLAKALRRRRLHTPPRCRERLGIYGRCERARNHPGRHEAGARLWITPEHHRPDILHRH